MIKKRPLHIVIILEGKQIMGYRDAAKRISFHYQYYHIIIIVSVTCIITVDIIIIILININIIGCYLTLLLELIFFTLYLFNYSYSYLYGGSSHRNVYQLFTFPLLQCTTVIIMSTNITIIRVFSYDHYS